MLEGAVVDVPTVLEGHHVLLLLIPGTVDEPHPVGAGLVPTIDVEGSVVISPDLCMDICMHTCYENREDLAVAIQ